jgi:hypothetical protein
MASFCLQNQYTLNVPWDMEIPMTSVATSEIQGIPSVNFLLSVSNVVQARAPFVLLNNFVFTFSATFEQLQ